MTTLRPKPSALATAVLAAAGLWAQFAPTAAQAEPAWITVGEQAYEVLRKVAPQARTLSSVAVPVTLPTARGALSTRAGTERVYAVEVNDNFLPSLSMMVHRELRKCGGYKHHDSQAEALATLHRLSTPRAPGPAPSYAIDNQVRVNALLPQLQASNILSTIQSLSDFQNRRYNSSHGVAASNWLLNAWQQLNPGNRRDIRVYQVAHAGWPQKSVVFEIVGASNNGQGIVIGGHLDSIAGGGIETSRAPGADDDASGIATMTEIIRVLMAGNYTPSRTIRFIAYAAEEVGLRGSQEFATNEAGRREQLVGVLQLDMTAYQGDATDLWLYTDYTDAAQNAFLANLASTYLPHLSVGYDACGYGCSDHAAWHNRGYIASFPFEASNANYNFRIHTSGDTIANFGGQAEHALKFAQLGLAYAVELASDLPQRALGRDGLARSAAR
jgi:leucyl aminopeptidase